jgi:hypothetical protein
MESRQTKELHLVFLPDLHSLDTAPLRLLAKSSKVLSRLEALTSVDANATAALKALAASSSPQGQQAAPKPEVALLVLFAQYQHLAAQLPTSTTTEFHAAGSGHVLAELLRGNCSISDAIANLRETTPGDLVPVVEPAWLARVAGASLMQCNHNDVLSVAKSVLRSLPFPSRVCVIDLSVAKLDVHSLIRECAGTPTIEHREATANNDVVHARKSQSCSVDRNRM